MVGERRYLNELLSAALLLAVAGALLYLLGDAFRSGFLAAFGIDKDVFPLSFEGMLLAGFEALLFLSPTWGVVLAFVAASAGIVAGAAVMLWRLRHKRRLKRLAAFFFHFDIDEAERDRQRHPVRNALADWFIRLLIFGVTIMFLLMLWTGAYSEGEELAADLRHRMDSGVVFSGLVGTWSYARIQYEGPEDKTLRVEGFVVESSPELCAVYVDEQVLLLPTARIVEIRISGASKDQRP